MARQNVVTGQTYKVGDQVVKAEWKWLYVFQVMHKYFKNLLYMFFDFNNMSNKSLTNKLLPIEATIAWEDWVSLTWYDHNNFDVEILATVVSASATTIDVTTITWDVNAKTTWFEVGDQILVVKADGTSARRTITAITATVITVNSAVAIAVGDKIIRIYYVLAREAEITRWFSKGSYIEYKSFFQNFGREVRFTKTDLNKSYLFEKDAKSYVIKIIEINMQILLQEFCKAVWLGQNDDDNAKPEMLGIDTAITQLAVKNPSVIEDFSVYTSDDEKIAAFMDQLELAGSSGAILPWETLTMACNRKMLSALGRLKKDDIVYNEKITAIDFTIFKFQNMFSQVEFFHDPILDSLSQKSLGYILPKSLMSLRFRQNQIVDENKNVQTDRPEIKFTKKVHNIHDLAIFDMYFEAATVLGWLSSGAYRKLINL